MYCMQYLRFKIRPQLFLSLGLRIPRPKFSELIKINIMIFLTCFVYFSGKFMSDHKGFSIYNESGRFGPDSL